MRYVHSFGTYEFTFPYLIDGHTAAEFDCRCAYQVNLGRRPTTSPPPGDPGTPDEIVDITDIEISVIVEEADGRLTRSWRSADKHLESLIIAFLDRKEEREAILDKARDMGELV